MVEAFPFGTCGVCGTGLSVPRHRGQSGRRVICDDPECRREANRYGAAILNARMARRRRQQPAPIERRCPRCGETKPLTEEHWYADTRDPQTGEVTRFNGWCRICKRTYQRETNNDARRARRRAEDAARRARMKADPEYAAEVRAAEAERKRQWRRTHPDVVRAIQRRYRERVKRDPARLQRQREAHRIAYRLRRERKTGRLAQRTRTEGQLEDRGLPRLPSAPLVQAIDRIIQSQGLAPDGKKGSTEEFLRGLGLEPRSVRAWRSGERKTVDFGLVDVALTRLDLTWWEVWPPEEHPDVARLFDAERSA